MANKSYHEVTDEEWNRVEKTLPPAKKTERPQIYSRATLNGKKSGAPWRFCNSRKKRIRTRDFSRHGSNFLQGTSTWCRQNAPGHETKRDIDSSRGGKAIKIHILVDEKFQGARVCIPDKENAKVKHDFDEEPYKKRNVVERFFCRLKDCLRITIRLNKLSSSFSGFVSLAIFLLSSRIRH